MSWLSSLFHGTKASQPDTSAQEAEAQRQRDAEDARVQALLDQQRQLYDQQRADDQARAQAQQKASQDQAAAQSQSTQDLINRQIAAQQAQSDQQAAAQRHAEELAQQDRAAQEAQAQARATAERASATAKNALIDKARGDVNDAYAGFNDDYFKNFEQSFVDTYRPQAERTFQKATADTTNTFGDHHNLRSSAAARTFGDLHQQLADTISTIGSQAATAAQDQRDKISTQKSGAMNTALLGASLSDTSVPDGFSAGDVSPGAPAVPAPTPAAPAPAASGGIGSDLTAAAPVASKPLAPAPDTQMETKGAHDPVATSPAPKTPTPLAGADVETKGAYDPVAAPVMINGAPLPTFQMSTAPLTRPVNPLDAAVNPKRTAAQAGISAVAA